VNFDDIPFNRRQATSMRGLAAKLQGMLERSERAKRPPPASEKGIPLLELGRRREDGVLRVSWCELEAGEPFCQVRLWRRDAEGHLRPTRRGSVIRLREMPEFADAIAKALDLAEKYAKTKSR
jgi:hypothetical protein